MPGIFLSIIKMDGLKFMIKNISLNNLLELRGLLVDFEEQIDILFESLNKLKIRDFIYKGYNEVQYLKSFDIKFNGYLTGNIINGRIDKIVLEETTMMSRLKSEDKNNNVKIRVDIYDYKTGSLKNFVNDLGQLGFYADAVRGAFGDENIFELKKYYYFIDEDELSLVK